MTMNIVGFDYDVVGNNLLELSIHSVTGLDGNDWSFFNFLKFDLNQFCLRIQIKFPS